VQSATVIASSYAHRTDPNALVVGPTGLAYNAQTGTLYVASTGDNAIYAIRNAASEDESHGKGDLVVKDPTHLHGPLGLILAPNGDLIMANGDAVNPNPNHPNELVEYTQRGQLVAQFQVDNSSTPGAAFGLAAQVRNDKLYFAAVDDNTNSLKVWNFEV
jgi:DNA-binding beta-propeller fold protein YncE